MRVVLAATSLFAIWLDPAEPARFVTITYTFHTIYFAYAVVVGAIMWPRSSAGRLPLLTLMADIAASALFQYLTVGPSSPFFTYFVFALFSSALRWGWRATIRTAIVVIVAFVAISASLSHRLGATEFELNRFIIRLVYLAVVSVLLVYLGQHEARLRHDIQRLARWPTPRTNEPAKTAAAILEHGARMLSAGRAVAVWELRDEPWVYVATWASGTLSAERFGPADLLPVVPAALATASFVCAGTGDAEARTMVSDRGSLKEWRGVPVHPVLADRLGTSGLGSSCFETERLSGRVFFGDISTLSPETLPLVEVIGREVGASFDQIEADKQSRQLAIAEDRVRLARDLHDGVLQSMTGIRLELEAMASAPLDGSATARLLGLERALAIEQRELRTYINSLRPSAVAPRGVSLEARLEDIRQRVALEWRTPISVEATGLAAPMASAVEHQVPLMVHEAIVNALKHGRPSHVAVEVQGSDDRLRVVVSDNGSGFPAAGHFDHATLVRSNVGPASLRDRVAALGGQLTIDSSELGARVEIVLPRQLAHV